MLGGEPRQRIRQSEQREDWRNAVAHATGLDGVDPEQLIRTIAATGQPGELAAMTLPGEADGFTRAVPDGSVGRNEASPGVFTTVVTHVPYRVVDHFDLLIPPLVDRVVDAQVAFLGQATRPSS